MRGALHKPDFVREKCPLVIKYHGFTGYKDEIHRMFVKMSRALETVGIAALRFDFAGSGNSDGNFKDMTFTGEVAEAEAVLDYSMSLDFADSKRVAILGLSMGGAVAGVLAAKRSRDIHKLCLWGAAGNLKSIIINLIEKNTRIEFDSQDYIDHLSFAVGKRFIQELDIIDVFAMSKAYNGKVLIVHGELDEVVPVENVYKYQNLYKDPDLHIISGADHVFQKIEWEEQVIRITKDFMIRQY